VKFSRRKSLEKIKKSNPNITRKFSIGFSGEISK
jgi:hypothetical protein